MGNLPLRNDQPPIADHDLLVFTATYNEADNIENLVRDVLAACPNAHMLVVDDASPDGTGQLLEQMKQADPRLYVVHRPQKLGLGSAHELAMLYAMQAGYRTLVTMDADHSHDPAIIPRLVSELAEADFVIGARYIKGGSCDYHGYRKMVSLGANRAARYLIGVPLHEFTNAFRAFRVDFIRRMDLTRIRSHGYSFFLESVYRLHKAGARLREIPIHFRDRRAGASKIPKFEIFAGMHQLTRLVGSRFSLAHVRESKPDLGGLTCYFCDSPWLVEKWARKGQENNDVSAYRCTSMGHASNPQVVTCLRCGLSFATSVGTCERHYADVVDEQYLTHRAGRYETFRIALERISGFLPKKGKMLEFGSYCGFFLDLARSNGWKVQGVEPSRWAAEYARRELGLNIVPGTVEEAFAQLEPNNDVIVMWDVLEHVDDPVLLLLQANALLKDGGSLCLSTLDIDNWYARALGRRWPWLMDMHIFYFRDIVLRHILKRAGFEVVMSRAYCHSIEARYLMEKLSVLLPGWLGKVAHSLKPLTPRFFVPFQFGDIKLYVCRKVEEVRAVTPRDSQVPFAVQRAAS